VPSMTRCPSGHFYDASKGSCPTCARLGQQTPAPPPTRPSPPPPPRPVPAVPRADTPPIARTTPAPRPDPARATPSHVTKAIWPEELGTDPIVGWLVAFEGKSVGRDYRLRAGRMRIGRGDNQDVQIDDEHIHRENHAFIIFDPLNCQFLLASGNERGLIYLGRKDQKPVMVIEPRELSPFDTIIIGKTKLFFVPFCSKTTFQWQEKGAAPDAGSNNPSPNQPEATTLIQSDDEW